MGTFKCRNPSPTPCSQGESYDRELLLKSRAEYERLYNWSIRDPEAFWGQMAKDYYWSKKVRDTSLQSLHQHQAAAAQKEINCEELEHHYAVIVLQIAAAVAADLSYRAVLCCPLLLMHCWFWSG